ncbi:ApeP family dehydratase [Roseateles terrae]|uniref:Hotdog family 3-hydroxylacyl-ACP dehydratase n=1 Tax=Roseateles terrae TaxID=431060 RepID=A0ABR6GQ69_9BURK|nr:hotdog family protein [Roseateles terrae]MBB3194246.1 putative hotdog family 3-hydroxylacyl-ACP dehydratase [Roseateles terrae]OWQ88090.1 3-hydroxylacyl-ACP dehydratase [Roseateles terrae]
MTDTLPPMAELVPHAGAMRLLDRVLEAEDERLVAEVRVPEDGLFSRDGGVDAWVGIEYMAQAVAAWAGWRGRREGQTPRIGFLLGTRRYRTAVARYAAGQVLQVEVRRTYQADNGLGQFDCQIRAGETELASATITVFGPEDPSEFLKGDTP